MKNLLYLSILLLFVSCSKEECIKPVSDLSENAENNARKSGKVRVTVDFSVIAQQHCNLTFRNLDDVSDPLVYALQDDVKGRTNRVVVELKKGVNYEVRYDYWMIVPVTNNYSVCFGYPLTCITIFGSQNYTWGSASPVKFDNENKLISFYIL